MARDGNKGVLEPLNRVSPQFLEGILLADRPIAPETIAAYRATGYRVLGWRPFVFKIGRPSRPLRRLHGRCGCWTSAFITAWNPLGTRTPDAVNEAAQRRLERKLKARRVHFIPGFGEDPSGRWPGEPSVLAIGLSLITARSLGARFKQNAIVWISGDAIPRLIMLRH